MVLCRRLPLVHCSLGHCQHLQASGEFTNLAIYEVSYMYYSAVACLWCIVVGVIISIYKPQVSSATWPSMRCPTCGTLPSPASGV